jgi:hypothetical protein
MRRVDFKRFTGMQRNRLFRQLSRGNDAKGIAMKDLLQKGQVFKCRKFRDLVGTLVTRYGQIPTVDLNNLKFDHSKEVSVCWTEHGKDGWKRDRADKIDLSIHDDTIADSLFEVIETELTGGGYGHGPHDRFPDGHRVIAKELGGKHRTVRFFQTGCFVGMVEPKDIDLVKFTEAGSGSCCKGRAC